MNASDVTTPDIVDETAIDPLARDRLRRGRRGAVVVALVVMASLLIAWAGSGARRGYLDPNAYDGLGSHAVAALLRDRGVTVVESRTAVDAAAQVSSASAAATTLLVTNPDLLDADQVRRLDQVGAATTVLLAPTTPTVLSTWAPGVTPSAGATNDVREPDCAWRPAVLAGGTRAGGAAYTVGSLAAGTTSERCYPFDGDPTVLHLQSTVRRLPSAAGDVTVLGDPLVLTNDQLAKDGNAALALNALGEHPTIVWYLPSLSEQAAGGGKSFFSLVPRGVTFALLQLAVVVILLALWRARRLGPVVVEPLPVVVRSSETVEGRGRLYRRAGARDRAGAALRNSTIDRLRHRLALPANGTPDLLVGAVAARSSRPAVVIRDLLYGAPPVDDAALVRLADDLDAIEREVTRT